MVSRRALYDECTALLSSAGKESADFDALCIFQDILCDKNPLFLPLEPVPEDLAGRIRKLTAERAEGYPLQYLLGKWEFYGLDFYVGEGVLIPRPDTETLVDQVIDLCRENKLAAPVIIDLCSGSGCIAIALKKHIPSADVHAVEISEKALGYLRKNKELNSSGIHIHEGDVLSSNTAEALPKADIIVSNPPYLTAQDMSELEKEVTCEPALALFGGNDGLGFYRAITAVWRKHLRAGGFIAYEFGMGQHNDVRDILLSGGFNDVTFRKDGAGIIRTAAAQRAAIMTQRHIDRSAVTHS